MKEKKSTALYATPFSKAYWKDAAAELKDVRMLMITALLIALRVAMKGLSIPLGPNLYINTAFVVNALGAMIYGPVVAIPAAAISDTIGCILFPKGVYFFPYIFIEIAGSLIFALFLYRARLTPKRIILSRFCIDFFINIVMNAPITWLYYKMIMGKSYILFQLPQIIKNLSLFPLESWILALFLTLMVPITYRMGLTYDGSSVKETLKFRKKQITFLIALFAVSAVCLTGYMFYHYEHTSLSSVYEADERLEKNNAMKAIVEEQPDQPGEKPLVVIIESAYRRLGKGVIDYTAAVYEADEAVLQSEGKTLEDMQKYSKSGAAKDTALTRLGTAEIRTSVSGTEVLAYVYEPQS